MYRSLYTPQKTITRDLPSSTVHLRLNLGITLVQMHYASRSLLQSARDLCTALYTVPGPDALWLADVVRM